MKFLTIIFEAIKGFKQASHYNTSPYLSQSSLGSSQPAMSSSFEYRQYFVPGWAISRHIIFSHIQFYLGPYATVRPYSYRGREGYLVTAPGQPLTRVGTLSAFCSGLLLSCLLYSCTESTKSLEWLPCLTGLRKWCPSSCRFHLSFRLTFTGISSIC